ncbi:UDP-N-acetylglucosamine--LPS N-acetylglucosamine transferase [Clostridium sp. MSJ-4]|uniref:UDP-N-acetylglucosamine--LPS N-acetylglucosamine transferase n=1 Tax=Clostridium simiarum TaxID=2841506 RepID=A0ABS6EVP8_9CLOT|nr:glycosyltransferase [Clostridium simiarum]MBU5590293.1 UDP-N-acetylglucosamine--LPS N-acetylglucosamine transferase [Clostridium simiarum]
MKLLILSVSAGGGHINAAEAIKAHAELYVPDLDVEIIDTIKYINPFLDKLIIGSYLKSIKLYPSIFGMLYNFAETDDGLATVSSKFNELMANKIIPLIDDFNPDIIISTHPFSTEMLSILKSKMKIKKPVISVLTDYAPHSFWIHPNIDAYVVATEEMAKDMAIRGVNPSQVFSFGIPVHPDFLVNKDRDDFFKELELDPNKLTLLLMGGSLGMGNILEVYSQLSKISMDFQIIAITGNNKKLLNALNEATENSDKPTKIVGFTKNVNSYMKCSDLLITKPGGLTVSEALISNLPLAIFSAIPGQEEKNAEFLLKHNLAIDLGKGNDCEYKIQDLLIDNNKLDLMKNNCKYFSKPDAGKNIIELIKNMTQ